MYNRIKKNIPAICLLIMAMTILGCVSQKRKTLARNMLTLQNSYCRPPEPYDYGSAFRPRNSTVVLKENSDLKKVFKEQSILILGELGCLDQTRELVRLEQTASADSLLKILSLKNTIESRINVALTQLSAVTAEFDCEGERVEQMANYLDNLNSGKNNRTVITSIIVGAVASVLGGVVSSDSWKNGAQIGGVCWDLASVYSHSILKARK